MTRLTLASGLAVRIDRGRCVCSENCARLAPMTFETDEDGLVTFLAGPFDSDTAIREAAATCPASAISVETADSGADR